MPFVLKKKSFKHKGHGGIHKGHKGEISNPKRLKILTGKDISRTDWHRLIDESRFSSPFQTPEYFDFMKSCKGVDAEVFALEVSGDLKVLMIVSILKEKGMKGFFSRRGIIWGGPLIREATGRELSFFLEESAVRMNGKAIYLETRNFFDYSDCKSSFIEAGWKYEPYLDVQLNLDGIKKEELPALFKYNRRREIKQSLENGATYAITGDEDEILSVYRILKALYRETVRLPLPSPEFFLEFFRSGILKVFAVKHEGKIIGGSFCPVLPGRGLYTYYYCGLRAYHKQIFPSHLAILGAMEYAAANKIPLFDLMGAGKPGSEYSVRDYKLQFGGTLVEYGRYQRIVNPLLYSVGTQGVKIFKSLKWF